MNIMPENTVEIQIRFVDLDAYLHVNNSVYMSYLEIARLALVKNVFFEDLKNNIQYLLIKVDLNYIKPVTFFDTLLVHCWFEEVSGAKFKIAYCLHNGEGIVFAKGFTIHALFNTALKRPVRIPREWSSLVIKQNQP